MRHARACVCCVCTSAVPPVVMWFSAVSRGAVLLLLGAVLCSARAAGAPRSAVVPREVLWCPAVARGAVISLPVCLRPSQCHSPLSRCLVVGALSVAMARNALMHPSKNTPKKSKNSPRAPVISYHIVIIFPAQERPWKQISCS